MSTPHDDRATLKRLASLFRRLWPRWPGAPRDSQSPDPAHRMFRRIRRHLTLVYAGVLGAILLLAGLVLYASMNRVLLGPIDPALDREATQLTTEWHEHGPVCGGGPFAQGGSFYLIACYDASGNLISYSPLVNLAPNFASPALARAALASPTGAATDTVDGGALNDGSDVGAIRREAVVIRDRSGQVALGVVQVGLSIQTTLNNLHVLLLLLLGVGALTLLGSAAGGALLAGRALADNLLTLARLDRGEAHAESDVVDLAEIAAGALRRSRALAEKAGITLTTRGNGPVLVVGDHLLLEQAALILLDNALKYNREAGSVTLHTYLSGQEAALEVADTGIGIPAEHLSRLGERFYRVDKARSRAKGGAGLGVSIARRIAALHGGALTFTSAPGAGTTATLRLPAARQSPP